MSNGRFPKKQKVSGVSSRSSVVSPKNTSVAVFIDNENAFFGALHNAQSFPVYKALIEKAGEYGRVVHAVAVCDWTKLAKGIPHVVQAGIEPVFSCHALTAYGKNFSGGKEKYEGKQSSSDSHIHVNVYEFMIHHPEVDVYVLVSGDRDFVPLVHSLKRHGKFVVVMSEQVSLSWDLGAVADASHTFQDMNALTPADYEKNIPAV